MKIFVLLIEATYYRILRNNPFSLQGKRVLFVGGSSGMGLGAAILADQLGAEVIVTSHNAKKLKNALAQLSKNAKSVTLDVTDSKSISALFEKVGNIDHLFMTAGPGSRSMFKEDPITAGRAYFEGKFWSTYEVTKVAIDHIEKNASITYVSGGFAIKPDKGSVPTTAAQNAVEGLAKALAVELAPIRFNVIRPGLINTSLWDFMSDSERDKMMSEAIKDIPSGRVGKAEDIGLAAISIMVNGYINGSVINVDGGSFLK